VSGRVTLVRPAGGVGALRVFRKIQEGGADELHEIFVPVEPVVESADSIAFDLTDEAFLSVRSGDYQREAIFTVGWLR